MQQDRSILDFVSDDLADLQRGSRRARSRRLTEYLDDVREIERRIQRAEQQTTPSSTVPDAPVGVPDSFEEHVGADVRSAGARLSGGPDARVHLHDGARVQPADLSADRRAPSRTTRSRITATTRTQIAAHAKVNTYHVALFAKFLERLRATPDGDGSLLDHSMILYGSGMSNGNVHTPIRCRCVLAGGARRAQGQPPRRRAGAHAERQPDVGDRRQVRRRARTLRRQHRHASSSDASRRSLCDATS